MDEHYTNFAKEYKVKKKSESVCVIIIVCVARVL